MTGFEGEHDAIKSGAHNATTRRFPLLKDDIRMAKTQKFASSFR